jgi:hypothetical protein
MGVALALNAKLYYGTAGSTAATEMTNVKDLTLNLSNQEADTSTRGSGGWSTTAATLTDGSIDFSMVWDTADAGFTAIKTAFFAKTNMAFLCLDEEGGQGLDADFTVSSFTRNETLTDVLMVDVSIKPAYSTRAPEWVEGS